MFSKGGLWRYRKRSNNTFAYLMITPSFVVIMLLIAYPVFFSFWISFTDLSMGRGLGNYNYVGISNFKRIFQDLEVRRVVLQSIWWTSSVFCFAFLIGISLALFLQSLRRVGSKILAVWLVPWVVPDVVAALIWTFLLHPSFGAFNHLLVQIGILQAPIAWLSVPYYAMWGVILAGIWRSFPFYLTMMYAAFQTLPEELLDAARIDGASRWTFFWYIQIPWIKPVLKIVSLLGFVWTFNWFSLIYGMTKGGPGINTMIIPVYVFKRALYYFDFSRASAFSVFTLGFLLVLVLLYLRSIQAREA